MDYLGLGRAVHEYLEYEYVGSGSGGRYREKYTSTIANRINLGKKISALRRIVKTSIGVRVDMGSYDLSPSTNSYPVFEIKPLTELAEGEGQIGMYVAALSLACPGASFDGGTAADWPDQPHAISVLKYTVIVMPPINGVITYISPDHIAHTIIGAVTVYELFGALQGITAAADQAAIDEIGGRLALSAAFKGIL